MLNIVMAKSGLQTLLNKRNEEGASALEYVGMVMVAALIVTAIVGAINSADISTALSTAITQILTGS